MKIRNTQYALRTTKRAFTLIEVLIALILISGGLIALVRMMSIGIFADSNLEYRLTAMNLANERLEELKNLSYSYVVSGTETGSAIGFDFVDNRIVTISYVDADLNASVTDTGLKNVTVQTQWDQLGTQTVTVRTLIADY